jgi:hypothetical protein
MRHDPPLSHRKSPCSSLAAFDRSNSSNLERTLAIILEMRVGQTCLLFRRVLLLRSEEHAQAERDSMDSSLLSWSAGCQGVYLARYEVSYSISFYRT